MLLSPNTVFCRWLLNSLRKEDQQRKKIAFSFCVRHNCCLCVKFGSQGIIFELRTCFSPQSRRSRLMWFSRSCTSESDGLPIEYCEPRIGRTEFQAVVTFLICGTIILLWWQFSCFAVSWGFWGGKENLWEIIASSPFLSPTTHFRVSSCMPFVHLLFTISPNGELARRLLSWLTDWQASWSRIGPAKLLDNCLDWLYDKLADHLLTSWVNRSLSWLPVWKTGSSLVDQQNDYTTVATDCLTNWLITCWPAEL